MAELGMSIQRCIATRLDAGSMVVICFMVLGMLTPFGGEQ
jgi:hypothetical protein